MRIICPTCASHYEVEIDQIGAAGQLVRCAQCREVWLVHPPVAAERARRAFPAAERVDHDPRAFAAAFEAHARASAEPIDFEAARQRLRPGKPGGGASRSRTAGLIGLAAALWVGGAGLALTWRDAIAARLPASAAVFAALHLPVTPDGLALRGVRSVVRTEGNHTVLSLEGEIANLRDGPVSVPDLTVVVRDDAQTPLYTWTAAAPKAHLAKGETVTFHSRLAAPPTDGRDVRVTFADAGTPPPRR